MTDDANIYRYADLVRQQTKQIQGMSAGQRAAQLGYSSLDDSFLPVLDALGQVRMQIGRQPDDTFAVTYANGTPPPTPTAPIVGPREGAALIGWDGLFAGGYDRPGDFARIDIHISEVDGFIPDGSTVVGYLPAEGAVLVPIDHVTHYVKLVCVTLSDVISAPTTQQQVLPEPIGQIAAGAIGAEQLAADIVLTNRFIAGDPDGARVEFGQTGLHAYDVNLKNTVSLSPDGNFKAIGEISSGVGDKRMVLNEEDNGVNFPEIRFYPVGTGNFSYLNAPPGNYSTDIAGIGINSGVVNGNEQNTVWLSDHYALMAHTTLGGIPKGPYFQATGKDLVEMGLRALDTGTEDGYMYLFDEKGGEGTLPYIGFQCAAQSRTTSPNQSYFWMTADDSAWVVWRFSWGVTLSRKVLPLVNFSPFIDSRDPRSTAISYFLDNTGITVSTQWDTGTGAPNGRYSVMAVQLN